MAAPQLTEQVQRQLVELMAEDRPDGDRLLGTLRELRDSQGISACASVVHLLSHLQLPESEAEQVLVDLLGHRDDLRRRLGTQH